MRTQMHQDAFPGEDISDRPPPEASVPGLLALIEGELPSGRLPGARARRSLGMSALAFQLPDGLEAHEPPEARGGRRDDVRLLVSDAARASIEHARFVDLPRFLAPGDLLVVNTSATLPAALPATRDDGTQLELRLSTPAPGRADDVWIIELRLGDAPFGGAAIGRAHRPARGRLGGAPRAGTPASGSSSRGSTCPRRCRSTWPSTGGPSATATSRRAGRWTPTRPCTRSSPAAPRCRAPDDRSRPS